MAKKKNNSSNKTDKPFPNQLKVKQQAMNLRFIGVNGRFGLTNKLFKDFSFDEMVEFFVSHNDKTKNQFFEGVVPPSYVSPFEQGKDIQPPKEEETTEEESE